MLGKMEPGWAVIRVCGDKVPRSFADVEAAIDADLMVRRYQSTRSVATVARWQLAAAKFPLAPPRLSLPVGMGGCASPC